MLIFPCTKSVAFAFNPFKYALVKGSVLRPLWGLKTPLYPLSDKLKQSCDEVKQIALQLHNQGTYPSETLVAKFMTMPGYLRYKKVRAKLQEAQLEVCK
ncbi:hypothetical protein H6G96_13340 [Nostoc sp. FACHB-892]|uniref:hypothetical protein n=1 Tax=Nostoc sp. FACHB-892 TaxID=2692843 RepID=UPI001685556E|nr:hypothetical protein [Nostoc sp. FACHB-892]MBD2727284.1 hypothetical protein [Nostoc sp. FACHB-892]